MRLKIQINDTGAWRHLFTFGPTDEAIVLDHVVRLAAQVSTRAKLRVVNGDGSIKAYATGPEFMWDSKVATAAAGA